VNNNFSEKIKIFIPGLIGFISCCVIFSYEAINPTNVNWIMYFDAITNDPITHYLGAEYFRNSNWGWPFGLNPLYGLDISSSIVYTDSIPILAFLLKLIGGVLPFPVQYLGIWLAICFSLQAIVGWLLCGLITNNFWIRLLGSCFFIFSVPFLMRVGRHSALAGQFLILFALYLNFAKLPKFPRILWLATLLMALLVNFYLFAIVGFLMFAHSLDSLHYDLKIHWSKFIGFWVIAAVLVMMSAYILGYFSGSPVDPGQGGYGFFRMHVLAVFDPQGWSKLFPSMLTSQDKFGPDQLSNGVVEGHYYLGAGLMLMLAIDLVYFRKIQLEGASQFLNDHKFLISTLILLSCFSITNNITIGNLNLYIPIPSWLNDIFSILRSAGRLFLPSYYVIILGILLIFVKINSAKYAFGFIFLALIIQIYDLMPGLISIHNRSIQSSKMSESIVLKSDMWESFAKKYKYLRHLPIDENVAQKNWTLFAPWALKHGMGTNFTYFGRLDLNKIRNANHLVDMQIRSSRYDPQSIYIVEDKYLIPILSTLNFQNDLLVRIDGFNVLLPEWQSLCNKCDPHSWGEVFDRKFHMPNVGEEIFFGRNGKASPFLLDVGMANTRGFGWSYPESWGVWSEGDRSEVIIPLPLDQKKDTSLDLVLKIDPYVNSSHPKQIFELMINNRLYRKYALEEKKIVTIPIHLTKSDVSRGFIHIEFKFDSPVSPHEMGEGNDIRKLSIGLISARFE
jgi:hypothetical protein